MSLLQNRDPDDAARRLADWLRRRMPGVRDLAVFDVSAPPSTGFSNETLLFEARWREDGEERSRGLVARVKATGFQVFRDYDVGRQYEVLRILGEATDVPVPRVFGHEDDPAALGAPFFVMERVAGDIPGDAPPYHLTGWMTEISPQSRASIWWSGIDAMARVHRVEWERLGLGFLETAGSAPTALERQLDDYERYREWAAEGRPQPVTERGLAWLRAARPGRREPRALCWGDSRIGNMIFRDARCAAVLDWEMATIANPLQDLAWWLFFDRHHSEGCDAPRLPGFPGRDETIERWSRSTGFSANDLEYYEVFAAFRFAVIMIRVGQHLVAAGVLPPDSDFETNNTATRMLGQLLAEP